MNILKCSFIIMIFLLGSQVSAANEGYEAWRKQVLIELDARIEDPTAPPNAYDYAYGQLSKDGGRALAKKRIKECDSYMKSNMGDPVLYYVRGWLGWMEYIFFFDDMEKAGTTERLFGEENQALIKGYQSYYYKALDLDDDPDALRHLDHYMLSTMDGVLAPKDLSERILKKSLKLNQQGDESYEGQEWTTYEYLLGTYAGAKDYDNYLKTVNEMIERFPNSSRMDELKNYKQQAEEVIAKREGKAVLETPQQDVYADAKLNEIVKAKAAEVKKAEQPNAEVADKASESGNNLWLLLGGGVVFLSLFVFFTNRRQKS